LLRCNDRSLALQPTGRMNSQLSGRLRSEGWAFFGNLPAGWPSSVDKSWAWGPSRNRTSARRAHLVFATLLLYGECMARFFSTTVRLDEEDVRALKRARAAGLSASDLIRKGLRVVASRYYSGRRPPSTLLFESTNSKLGDESELFRDIED